MHYFLTSFTPSTANCKLAILGKKKKKKIVWPYSSSISAAFHMQEGLNLKNGDVRLISVERRKEMMRKERAVSVARKKKTKRQKEGREGKEREDEEVEK